ncbi:MAG: hypothetical protein L3J82_03995, partial [Planctomycetes bacterium]|nr:hypothetical protein [Planctomycetota bacterium]
MIRRYPSSRAAAAWVRGTYPEAIDPQTDRPGSVGYQQGALGAYYLDEAERYLKNYPNWYKDLPLCPLTNPDKPNLKTNDGWASEGASDFHPGATECFRSYPTVFNQLNFIGPGQQCCYDEEDKLILDDAGAGTPDRRNTTLLELANG